MSPTHQKKKKKLVNVKALYQLELGGLASIALAFVVAGLIITYGADIVDTTRDSVATCNSGYTYNKATDVCYNSTNASQPSIAIANGAGNASSSTLNSLTNLSSKLPSIGVILGASLIIGVLVAAFRYRNND